MDLGTGGTEGGRTPLVPNATWFTGKFMGKLDSLESGPAPPPAPPLFFIAPALGWDSPFTCCAPEAGGREFNCVILEPAPLAFAFTWA